MSTVHSRIKEARQKRGLSQEKLADDLGVSRQAVQQWETEPDPSKPDAKSTAPKRTLMPEVAKLLGVSVAWLATGKDGDLDRLDPMEQQWLELYRSAPSAHVQETIIQVVSHMISLSRGGDLTNGDPYGGKLPPKKKN